MIDQQSDLEAAFDFYLRTLGPDLPEPEREFCFAYHLGRKFRFDFAWPYERLAVEVDGGIYKPGGGRHGQDSDRVKLNLAAQCGSRVLRFSGAMLHDDPAGMIEQIRAALSTKES